MSYDKFEIIETPSGKQIMILGKYITIPGRQTVRLQVGGKYCPDDIVIHTEAALYESEPPKYYTGAYEVTPGLSETVLDTSGLLATGNITIKPIPVSRVDNDAGGQTVTIG